MHLSDHSLSQLDEACVQVLDEGPLRGLSLRLLADLKEARERLRQTPTKSSRPPSSQAPWERPSAGQAETNDAADNAASTPAPAAESPDAASPPPADASDSPALRPPARQVFKPTRRPGKPAGAPGRTQVFKAHEVLIHRPETCGACAAALPADAPTVAYAGFQVLDLRWGDGVHPGMHITDYRFHDRLCGCGRHTRARPGVGLVEDPRLAPVALSEWHLVGPGLASLSGGTLADTLHEAAAASAPLEQELIDSVLANDMLHAGETSGSQGTELLWLWVFSNATVTRCVVAKRGREVRDRLLPGFAGGLVSDGWQAYRHLPQRLRCWVHFTRNAQGLIDSDDREAQAFGQLAQLTFDTLISAIMPRATARRSICRPSMPPGPTRCMSPARLCSSTVTPRRAPWPWRSRATGR